MANSETIYAINVKTSSIPGAATDANVFVHLYGQKGDIGPIALDNSINHDDTFELGQSDVFVYPNYVSIGDLTKIKVWHDNTGEGMKGEQANWHMEFVEVYDIANAMVYRFNCNQWFSRTQGDRSISREIFCSSRKSKGPFQLKSGQIGFAASTTTVTFLCGVIGGLVLGVMLSRLFIADIARGGK